MNWVTSTLVCVNGAATCVNLGFFAAQVLRHARERRRNSRCSWCGARRDNPKRSVCDLCIETVHPLASGHGWPADGDG